MSIFSSEAIKILATALSRSDNFIFLETCRLSADNHRSMLFMDAGCWLELRLGEDPDSFFQRLEAFRQQGYAVAGWLAYELGYLLEPSLQVLAGLEQDDRVIARFGIFASPLCFDHRGESSAIPEDWLSAIENAGNHSDEDDCSIYNIKPDINQDEFYADLERIKEYILAGDSYQVNYTFRLNFDFSGSPASLYGRLRRNQSVAYGAWLRFSGVDIMSFSPELFFHAEKSRNRIRVRPMKGTALRGLTLTGDKVAAENLCNDSKIISENIMIVDLLRNDLGRLLHESGGGMVQVQSLFDVEPYESLLQLTSTIDGYFVSGGWDNISLSAAIYNLFPCGSVTGAPKVRTMEIIRELEKTPRGVYCGAIGWSNNEEICFNVAIRTLTITGGKGRMGIGAGIVHDSDPAAEWRECLLKGRFLTNQTPEFELIETMLWRPGAGFVFLEPHLERLMSSAGYFFFSADRDEIYSQLRQYENENLNQETQNLKSNSLKVDMQAGSSMTCPCRSDHLAALVAADQFIPAMLVRLTLDRDGIVKISSAPLITGKTDATPGEVVFSRHRVDPEDVFLYHKTTNRHLYNQERQRAKEQGLYEILFVNTRGEVSEGTISTLFAEIDGRLYTPPLASGLLPGVYRDHMLASGQAEERLLTINNVRDADQLFMANSVRGMVRVVLRV